MKPKKIIGAILVALVVLSLNGCVPYSSFKKEIPKKITEKYELVSGRFSYTLYREMLGDRWKIKMYAICLRYDEILPSPDFVAEDYDWTGPGFDRFVFLGRDPVGIEYDLTVNFANKMRNVVMQKKNRVSVRVL